VTERMVTDHFADRSWTESNGRFETAWTSSYDKTTGIADSIIRVNTGPECLVRERVYPGRVFQDAVKGAGLTLLAAVDADTWRAPRRRTTRIDFVAAKRPKKDQVRRFDEIRERIRRFSLR